MSEIFALNYKRSVTNILISLDIICKSFGTTELNQCIRIVMKSKIRSIIVLIRLLHILHFFLDNIVILVGSFDCADAVFDFLT